MVQLRNNFYMIPVESDWNGFEFNESAPNLLMFCTPESIKHIPLPPGQWELISFGDKVSKEEAGRIAEVRFCKGGRLAYGPDYKNYFAHEKGYEYDGYEFNFSCPIKSVHSLIRFLGFKPNEVVIVHKIN